MVQMSKRSIKTPNGGGGKCVSCLLLLCVLAFGTVIILTTNNSKNGTKQSKLNAPFSKEDDGFLGLKKLFSSFGESKSKNPRGTRKGLKGTTKGKKNKKNKNKKTEFTLKNSAKLNIGDIADNVPKPTPKDEKPSKNFAGEAPQKDPGFQWPDTMEKETKAKDSKAKQTKPKDSKAKQTKPKASVEKKPAQKKGVGKTIKPTTAGEKSKTAGKKPTKKESKIETKTDKTAGMQNPKIPKVMDQKVGNAPKGSNMGKKAPVAKIKDLVSTKTAIEKQEGSKKGETEGRTMSGTVQGQLQPKKVTTTGRAAAEKGTKKAGEKRQ